MSGLPTPPPRLTARPRPDDNDEPPPEPTRRYSNQAGGILAGIFGLVLVLLILAVIPGIVLFALNVFGQENKVNGWLQNKVRLSYHIPIAWWAALLLLLVPFVILILYFLKLKRRPVQ